MAASITTKAGINAAVRVQPNLTFAVQAAVRDAGISDDGSLRLDYAVADYRLFSEATVQAGFRAGKVKNAVGFYNETRDVIFTRPSILLPSVYNDNQNQRSSGFHVTGRADLRRHARRTARADVHWHRQRRAGRARER